MNYVMWRLVFINIDFVPNGREIYLKYTQAVYGVKSLPSERDVICATTVTEYLPWAAGYLYANYFKEKHPNAKLQVRNTFVLNLVSESIVNMDLWGCHFENM